jgi:erythromycin esterase-like protein
MGTSSLIESIRREAVVLREEDGENAVFAVLQAIGDARIVLLGEATHGSHEFYRMRSRISQRLIKEKGFDAIAVEADWPDALRVSRYVQKASDITGQAAKTRAARDALAGFQRFPRWMWRNTDVLELVEWLHKHNAAIGTPENRVGFFGLDLYSLRNSMDSVVRYLEQNDPELAQEARQRYACFDHLAEDPQLYGHAVVSGRRESCEREVARQLSALFSESARILGQDGAAAEDELFYAQQNARVAQNAELYYRAMFSRGYESWNARDTHMADTLEALCKHIADRRGRPAKVAVWAHNSHLGDARATEPGEEGELNLGQLVRERFEESETFLLGFTTHTGTVAAASDRDNPPEIKKIRPSLPNSVERLFHDTGLGNFLLSMRGSQALRGPLSEPRLERAIGVVYRPETERMSHYFHVDLARQFDAVVHIDESRAVEPLDQPAPWRHDELPETYPSGM